MEVLNIAALIAGAGVVAATWKQIYATVKTAVNYIIVPVVLDPLVAGAVFTYCNKHMLSFRAREKTIKSQLCCIKSLKSDRLVAFDSIQSGYVFFLDGFKPLIIYPGNAIFVNGHYKQSSKVLLPRFFWDAEKLILSAIAEADQIRLKSLQKSTEGNQRFFIRKVCGQNKKGFTANIGDKEQSKGGAIAGPKDAGNLIIESKNGISCPIGYSLNQITDNCSENNPEPFSVFPYPKKVLLHVEEMRRWKKSEDWYKERNIPWRRGWLLHGLPGTGKTLLIKSVAQDLDIPIIIFDLASMSNEEVIKEWNSAKFSAPCAIVFEDFDAVFHGRQNIAMPDGGVTFDCILNCLSGMQQFDGVFIAITTNHLDKIDPAIGINTGGQSSRPGRIDTIMEVGPMEEDCRTKLAARLFEMPPNSEYIQDIVREGEGMTAAQFSEICTGRCLQLFWSKQDQVQVQEPCPCSVSKNTVIEELL